MDGFSVSAKGGSYTAAAAARVRSGRPVSSEDRFLAKMQPKEAEI